MKEDQRNLILFAVIAAAILFAWQPLVHWIFPAQPPAPTRIEGGKEKVVAASTPQQPQGAPAADAAQALRDRNLVLAETPRIRIETPTLRGSINLKGARIDDLVLLQHGETVAKNSPPIRLLSPAGTTGAYFADFGWGDGGLKPPSPDTLWRATGDVLAPGRPVTLDAANASGQRFRIELAVDEHYMFTVKQTVANFGTTPVPVTPWSRVKRVGMFHEKDSWTLHIGPVAVHDGRADYDTSFDDLAKAPFAFQTTGGWLGFTDKYWLAAVIPDQGVPVAGQFRSSGAENYQADFSPQQPYVLAPGRQVSQTSRFYAGAKETRLIANYESQLGIAKLSNAIDWGWFEIIEKPIFYYLDWLFRLVGNFGVAIILLTITIRGLLFPIAQRQFASMAAMRAVQPKMKALQERYKDDKPKLQQEMMKLYRDEKVNPLAGCLPLFLQIPIMFALYKVLLLSVEMRHQPFVGWIRDLSAPDPLTPINLFGLLPFDPPGFLHIGVIPILLGVSMYFQIKLNPAPMDEIQKQVFSLMPWVLMFLMAPFAVGLQLYWITSNVLTIAQQSWLYSRHPQLKVPLPKKESAAK